MDIAQGNLTLLGNATVSNKGKSYSTIEIGNTLLKDIYCESSLDNFLNRALGQSGNTKLYYVRNSIVGVELPDGNIYLQRFQPMSFITTIILSVLLCWTIILPVVFIGHYLVAGEKKEWDKYAQELLNNGAIEV